MKAVWVLITMVFFSWLCSMIFLKDIRKRRMQKQLGSFFKEELEKAFGPELHTPEMAIDGTFMEGLGLFQGKWEEWEAENPYEGRYQRIHFNAANIRLYHVYKAGHIRDGYEKKKEVVFKGVVIRYEDAPALVLKTDYNFASVADGVDLRDIDAVKESYIASLEKMKELLEEGKELGNGGHCDTPNKFAVPKNTILH